MKTDLLAFRLKLLFLASTAVTKLHLTFRTLCKAASVHWISAVTAALLSAPLYSVRRSTQCAALCTQHYDAAAVGLITIVDYKISPGFHRLRQALVVAVHRLLQPPFAVQ